MLIQNFPGGERRQTLWEGALTLYFAIISQIPIELKKSGQGERGEVDISQNFLRRSVQKNPKNPVNQCFEVGNVF